MIALDIFQTGATSVSWQQWFMETGQIITVTGQMHCHPYYYQSCTTKLHCLKHTLACMLTYNTHCLTHCLTLCYISSCSFLEPVKQNSSHYIWQIDDFVSGTFLSIPISYLVKYRKLPVNANTDINWSCKCVEHLMWSGKLMKWQQWECCEVCWILFLLLLWSGVCDEGTVVKINKSDLTE